MEPGNFLCCTNMGSTPESWNITTSTSTLVVLLNLVIPVNTSMKKQLSCLILELQFAVTGQQNNTQYREVTTQKAYREYEDAFVQASIDAISNLTKNRVVLTMEKAVQMRAECLELMTFCVLNPFKFKVLNASTTLAAIGAEVHRLSTRDRVQNGPKAMLNVVRSIKKKIEAKHQAKHTSKKPSYASEDEAKSTSSSSESVESEVSEEEKQSFSIDDIKENKRSIRGQGRKVTRIVSGIYSVRHIFSVILDLVTCYMIISDIRDLDISVVHVLRGVPVTFRDNGTWTKMEGEIR
eukprot:m51a1_g11263 hypothetical protein (294) ;mRNA; r:6510-15651